jgi:hypothetical protein
MTAMYHMVDELMQDRRSDHRVRVSQEDYKQWARGFVFEGLRDQRYGQSFCNRFGIRDNILFYSSTVEEADRYIQENYVR